MKKAISFFCLFIILMSFVACGDTYNKYYDYYDNYETSTIDSNEKSDDIPSSPTYNSTNISSNHSYNYGPDNASSFTTDPKDYGSVESDGKPRYLYANLSDIVYNGIGNNFKNIMDYSGQTSTPSTVGFSEYGEIDPYYTYFGNHYSNVYLLFNAEGDMYFGDNDSCYGAIGWLGRVFDYDKTRGPCDAHALAEVLNAKNTYILSDTSNVRFVPRNLNTDSLYVIEADIEMAQGIRSCTVYLEADSDDDDIYSDTWVQVVIE